VKCICGTAKYLAFSEFPPAPIGCPIKLVPPPASLAPIELAVTGALHASGKNAGSGSRMRSSRFFLHHHQPPASAARTKRRGMTTARTMVAVLDLEGGAGCWSTEEELPDVEMSPTHS
jgi:hypothetical protein